jgi:hypothetical protein
VSFNGFNTDEQMISNALSSHSDSNGKAWVLHANLLSRGESLSSHGLMPLLKSHSERRKK